MPKRFLMTAGILGALICLGAAVSLVSPAARASAPAAVATVHRVFIPRRGPDGIPLRTPRNQFESGNWSGYVLPNYSTGQQYTAASSTWTVQGVASTVMPGYSSSWVGIGGFCLNAACHRADNTLIQLGTEQDVNSSGNTSYYAWYEMLPNPEILIPTVAVHPGDVISASLALQPVATSLKNGKNGTHGGNAGNGGKKGGSSGSSNTWLLTLTNQTTGQSWSKTVSYKSSLASAEWVQEAPYSAGILPLADFGTARFDLGTVNGGQNPGLTVSESVVMFDSNGQTSNVSNPDTDTDGFNACWGSGTTLTPCASPQS